MADKIVERRRKKDWVVRSVSIVAVLGWFSAIASLFFISGAQPRGGNLITRLLDLNIHVARSWDTHLLNWGFLSLLVSFGVCVAGMLANMARHRRKTDRYNKAIIILGALSFLGIIAFLITFA
jgi:hypothetical protein